MAEHRRLEENRREEDRERQEHFDQILHIAEKERRGGEKEMLGAVGQAKMAEGDVFVISTPGGGAYGGDVI